jgi:hypothetical protein
VESIDPRRAGPGRIPVPGAVVRARPVSRGAREIVVRADLEGRFSIDGLPLEPDGGPQFYLSAEADGHVPAYYPGVTEWREAEPVAPAPPGARVVTILPIPVQLETGPHFAVGVVRSSVPTIDPGVERDVPPDGTLGVRAAVPGDLLLLLDRAGHETEGYHAIRGAYLYLVPAEPMDDDARPVAGSASAGNGTLVLALLPAGRYRAFADRPGYEKGWFHGTGPEDAAVIQIGPGIEPVLIDIVLDPVEPDSGGISEGDSEGPERIVTGLFSAPNPFQSSQTTVVYRLMAPAEVSVGIYDIQGRRIRTLFDRVSQQSGEQRVPWDGHTDEGEAAGAGIYFFRVWTERESSTGKMVMIR